MELSNSLLWNIYKDTLNDEAREALRQVILDVESHECMKFKDADNLNDAFYWACTKQGHAFWCDVDCGKYDKPVSVKDFGAVGDVLSSKPVKSDGGSSDYYKIVVKTSHGMADVEVNDLIYALVGGDFDLGNVLKASRRMYLASKGCGKEGVDIAYDVNKCKWFLDDFQMRFGKE